MACHDIGEETDHQGKRLREYSHKLNGRDEGESLKGHWHVGPENFLPVMLVATELYDDKRAQGKEESNGDITGHIASAWRKRNKSHDIAGEDEEEASEQIGTILLIAFSYTWLDNIVDHIHHEHLNEPCEALGRIVTGLVLAIPAGRQENAQQQYNDTDKHRGHGLRDRDVERTFLLSTYQFHNLSLIVTFGGYGQTMRPHLVSIGIRFFLKSGTAEHMPTSGTVHDDGQVYHYRDKKGLECDAVVHLRNGSYGLIEIKLGGDTLIDEGAKSLTTLAADIDTTRMKSPSFLMVLTGIGDFPYQRDDGVYVVPIGCLKD